MHMTRNPLKHQLILTPTQLWQCRVSVEVFYQAIWLTGGEGFPVEIPASYFPFSLGEGNLANHFIVNINIINAFKSIFLLRCHRLKNLLQKEQTREILKLKTEMVIQKIFKVKKKNKTIIWTCACYCFCNTLQ